MPSQGPQNLLCEHGKQSPKIKALGLEELLFRSQILDSRLTERPIQGPLKSPGRTIQKGQIFCIPCALKEHQTASTLLIPFCRFTIQVQVSTKGKINPSRLNAACFLAKQTSARTPGRPLIPKVDPVIKRAHRERAPTTAPAPKPRTHRASGSCPGSTTQGLHLVWQGRSKGGLGPACGKDPRASLPAVMGALPEIWIYKSCVMTKIKTRHSAGKTICGHGAESSHQGDSLLNYYFL